MKKIYLILSFVFAITAAVGTANARVKCVPLVGAGNQTTCTSNPNSYAKHIDWAAECTTSRTNPGGSAMKSIISEIKGIAACSNQDGGAVATTSETIATSSNVNDNSFCWCKMTTPAVSLWVFYDVLVNAGGCAEYCAKGCAKGVQADAAFRSALFSNMTD